MCLAPILFCGACPPGSNNGSGPSCRPHRISRLLAGLLSPGRVRFTHARRLSEPVKGGPSIPPPPDIALFSRVVSGSACSSLLSLASGFPQAKNQYQCVRTGCFHADGPPHWVRTEDPKQVSTVSPHPGPRRRAGRGRAAGTGAESPSSPPGGPAGRAAAAEECLF